MKAIVQHRYGSPDVLELRDIDTPQARDNEVLVRVHAAAVNPADWHFMRGDPYIMRIMGYGLRRPKNEVPGMDVAGRVEAVGSNVTRLRPGDEVFGWCVGTFAEYTRGEHESFIAKPAILTFEQAAAVPVAGMTALQALRDEGALQPGHKVLINGASGGVGTFAVQIAKSFGAHVTGVCSTRNVDMVRSIGADHVIDYTREDFTRNAQRYDVILDNVANHSLSDCRRMLTPGGTLIPNNGDSDDRWIGAAARAVNVLLVTPFVRERMRPVALTKRTQDLVVLKELIEDGKVTPVIDRTYPLSEAAQAIGHVEDGHARGKVIITV